MNSYYSPIWFDSYLPWQKKPRRITSIKFEMGERLKYCKRCDDWHPADTEFFNESKIHKVGLSAWCRACNDENQNIKRYWENKTKRTIAMSNESRLQTEKEAAGRLYQAECDKQADINSEDMGRQDAIDAQARATETAQLLNQPGG